MFGAKSSAHELLCVNIDLQVLAVGKEVPAGGRFLDSAGQGWAQPAGGSGEVTASGLP